MGWDGIVPFERDVPFNEVYRDALQQFPALVKDQPPKVERLNWAKLRVRQEMSDETLLFDDDMKTVEAWVVFQHEGKNHLAVILFQCFSEGEHIGWWKKTMGVEEGPYVKTRPSQELTDMVEVKADSEYELDFRRRMDVWPSGYQSR